MGLWTQLGMQAAGQAAGGIMGLALGGLERKAQLNQQAKLQQLEMQGQRQMTDYNLSKQMELWEKTNYSAQVEQLKKAGLNPALLYGMSGGGGQTTDVATGHVGSGSAQMGNFGLQGMELGARMRQQAEQLQLMEAQRKNIEADTDLKRTNIPKVEAETSGVLQSINNAKAQEEYTKTMTALQGLDLQFQKESYRTRLNLLDKNLETAIETVKRIGLENKFTEQTWDDAAKEIQQKAIQAELQNELTKVQTKAAEKGIQLTEAQIGKIAQDIAMGWKGLKLQELQGMREDIKLKQSELQLLYNEMKTKFEVSHPGLWNVIGGTVEETIKETVQNIQEKIKRIIPKL